MSELQTGDETRQPDMISTFEPVDVADNEVVTREVVVPHDSGDHFLSRLHRNLLLINLHNIIESIVE